MPLVIEAAKLATEALEHFAPGAVESGVNLLKVAGERSGLSKIIRGVEEEIPTTSGSLKVFSKDIESPFKPANQFGLTESEIEDLGTTATAEKRRFRQIYHKEYEASNLGQDSHLPGGGFFDNPLGLYRALDNLMPEVGSHFHGHGIENAALTEQISVLDRLLTKGPDPGRTFYEMPLRGAEAAANLFGASRPFDKGAFIVVSKAGSSIYEGGIQSVLVNDHLNFALPKLASRYPNFKFIPHDKVSEELPVILKNSMPREFDIAMTDAATRVAAENIAAEKLAVEKLAAAKVAAEKAESERVRQSATVFTSPADLNEPW